MKNIQKQNQTIRSLHKKLTDIRTNHLHQATSGIVKTKPSRIVMEKLNIKGMMKNKHLSKAIAQQGLYEFKRQIQYKCKKYGSVADKKKQMTMKSYPKAKELINTITHSFPLLKRADIVSFCLYIFSKCYEDVQNEKSME